jgi:phosphoribosylamine--glycine ligase
MNVLVVGSGGREHALCWALSASPLVDALYCAPGNGGIDEDAICVDVATEDIEGLIALCREKAIEFVVIGPEAPLAAGLVDRLEAAGIAAFGPSAAAARLESSKGFTKELCARHGIPTAAFGRFAAATEAKAYIRRRGAPIVVKMDGLAAGKGVVVAETLAEAERAVDEAFAAPGAEIVVEEFLSGEEVSFFALVDGETVLPLVSAQDHKRVGEGDRGPNTGGMGAYSPAPLMTAELERATIERILRPTVRAMAEIGAPYRGVLYAGLMVTAEGPQLLEYNVRFGDPECQVLMMRLKSDLLPALLAVQEGMLAHVDLRWHDDAALGVVMAARGYPGRHETGSVIGNLGAAGAIEGVKIFHAGTRREADLIRATGGRVLTVTARGRDIAEARQRAYRAVDLIDWPEGFCRRDIGWRARARASGPQ